MKIKRKMDAATIVGLFALIILVLGVGLSAVFFLFGRTGRGDFKENKNEQEEMISSNDTYDTVLDQTLIESQHTSETDTSDQSIKESETSKERSTESDAENNTTDAETTAAITGDDSTVVPDDGNHTLPELIIEDDQSNISQESPTAPSHSPNKPSDSETSDDGVIYLPFLPL